MTSTGSFIDQEEDASEPNDRFQSTWESHFESSNYFHPLKRKPQSTQSANASFDQPFNHTQSANNMNPSDEPLLIESLPEANPLLMPSKPCDFLPRILIHDYPYSDLPFEVNRSVERESEHYQGNSEKKYPRVALDQSESDALKSIDIDLINKQNTESYSSNATPDDPQAREQFRETNSTLFQRYEQSSLFAKVYAKYKCEKSIDELKSNYAGRSFDLSCAADFSNSMFTTFTKQNRNNSTDEEIFPEFDLYSRIDQEKKDSFAEQQKEISFDSRFECGNLLSAFSRNQNKEYDLILENDTNSKGYAQWFFFKVDNYNFVDATVTFNIVNISKGSVLYNFGMKPAVFSLKDYEGNQNGWSRNVSKVLLKKSQSLRMESDNAQSYYTLSFTYTFTHLQDSVYFAMNIPYSYTKMINYINFALSQINYKTVIAKKEILCYSISNNAVPILTITERSGQIKNEKKQILNKKKPIIWIIARQHPGETAGSYKMEGVIDYILSPAHEAKQLRSKFIFKIIPMMNPDGVIYGNMRCDLSGVDINRSWISPSKVLNPTVFYTKRAIQQSRDYGMKMQFFIDLHGHSKKLNSFIYACRIENDEVSCRVFPGIMASISSKFSFKDCTFSMEEFKESAARIVIWNELNRPERSVECCNIFTVETSFFGFGTSKKPKQFSIRNLLTIGADLLKSIYIDSVCEDPQRYPNVSKNSIINSIERYDFSINKFKQESGSDSDIQPDDRNVVKLQSPLEIQQKQEIQQSLDFKIVGSTKQPNYKSINRPIFPSPLNIKNKLLPSIIEQQQQESLLNKLPSRQKKRKQETIKIVALDPELNGEVSSVSPEKILNSDILKYLESTPAHKEAFPQRILQLRKAQGGDKQGQVVILLKERQLKRKYNLDSNHSHSQSPSKRGTTPKFSESTTTELLENSPSQFRRCSSKLLENISENPVDSSDAALSKRRSPYLLPISLSQIKTNKNTYIPSDTEIANRPEYFAVQKRENVLLQNIIIPNSVHGDTLTSRAAVSSRLSNTKEESGISFPRSIRPSFELSEQRNLVCHSSLQSSTVECRREVAALPIKTRDFGISAQTEQGRTKKYYGSKQTNEIFKDHSQKLEESPSWMSKNPSAYASPQKKIRKSGFTSFSENRSDRAEIKQDKSFEDLSGIQLSEKSQRMKYFSKHIGVLEKRTSANLFPNNISGLTSFEIYEEPQSFIEKPQILTKSPQKQIDINRNAPLPFIPLSREASRMMSRNDHSAIGSEFTNSPKNEFNNRSEINEDFHKTNEIFISKHKAQGFRSISVRNRVSFTKLQQKIDPNSIKKEEEGKIVRNQIKSPLSHPKSSLTSHIPIKIANCLHNKRNRAQINNNIYNQK